MVIIQEKNAASCMAVKATKACLTPQFRVLQKRGRNSEKNVS